LGLILFLMVVKPTFSFGSGGGALPACTPASSSTDLSINAKNIAFSTGCLGAPAGQGVTLTFANDDTGVPHNVAVYRDASAKTVAFRGQVVTGTTTVTYHVPALAAGSYLFRCDVHPFMKGTLVVGGGSGSSP
jgi:plastocyanin